MSSQQHEVYRIRAWMYNRRDPVTREITQEFKDGLQQFLTHAINQPSARQNYGNKVMIYCPCKKCENVGYHDPDTVWKHVYTKGFCPNYYVWFSHGEDFVVNLRGSSSSSRNVQSHDASGSGINYGNSWDQPNSYGYGNLGEGRFHDMVTDAFRENTASFADTSIEEPNADAKRFYDMLDAANEPLYDGCREGLSKLSLAARMMTIKSEDNLSESCMDKFASLFKEYLPENNNSAETYYEIQRLVMSLGLPYEMIDVCVDNCMLFWKDDASMLECKFCGKPRYKESTGRTKIPFQRMWYLPLTDRLKRLYQSDRTAAAMRWHAEHSTEDGVITHPSDAAAWKHFNTVHSDFAEEIRNVYLGLCTDGFSPFGFSGRQYSLWPVIVTPYNLPPDMCMQREFLFLSILVPGPNHPRRSLDVFLQPLIHELQELWHVGAQTYDSSVHRNFNMKAVLMWTISDFPAYGMLSGWTTHGKLACPYCQEETNSFMLKNGRKPCWFDCHRRFLPHNHPYRRNRKLFTKKKVVKLPPPVYRSAEDQYVELEYYGAQETVVRGGNWHTPGNMPFDYGVNHNWHKKSIFWDLPYWKDHLLRHNLDVMHVEKNVFENIINTILNVQGRTKDNLKSRLDLPEVCARPELHITNDGRVPVPNFRLSADAKATLFKWIKEDVKFPDGYVSTFSNCVQNGQKFSGMKSHDCHVFMQRLVPFAFTELLPPNVHESIAALGAFFRDLCARTLTEADIDRLSTNIPVILCNLEKVFPPSFFDVMEHLVVHLAHEVALGGPVHFRWMYPFERFFKYLKLKAKNLARVEGSIVQGSLTEETSNFSSYYFSPTVKTKKTGRKRYDDGGVGRTYHLAGVPDTFSEVGRMAGRIKERMWEDYRLCTATHTYILLNCDYFRPYESMLDQQIREAFPELTDDEVRVYLERDFAGWLQAKVTRKRRRSEEPWPLWVHEFVNGPIAQIRTSKMYCTRGFTFHTFEHGRLRATANYGIHVPGETNFYGILKDIIEVQYAGTLGLRCVLFKCDWFNTTPGYGVRTNSLGVVDVHKHKSYAKFEPFILASQAEQVAFVPYPSMRVNNWLSVVKVNPRGRIVGLADDVSMQAEAAEGVSVRAEIDEDVARIDPENSGFEDICEDTEVDDEAPDEFGEGDDTSAESENGEEGDEEVGGEDEDYM